MPNYVIHLNEELLKLVNALCQWYSSLHEMGNEEERYALNSRVHHGILPGIDVTNKNKRTPEKTYQLIQEIRKQCEQILRNKEIGYE
jgi:hypothetical protein